MRLAVTLIVVGGWAPGLAATAVTAWDEGRPGVRELLSQFKRWRVRPIWWVAALLGPGGARLDRSRSYCADGWDNTSSLAFAAPCTSARPDRGSVGRGTWLARLCPTAATKRNRFFLGKHDRRDNLVCLALLARSDASRRSFERVCLFQFSDLVGVRSCQLRPDGVAVQQHWRELADRLGRTCRTHTGPESGEHASDPFRLVRHHLLGRSDRSNALVSSPQQAC